jgi:parallel beta-helix repeat protein
LAAAAVVIVAPAPTPIPANTVNVPSSIDATGSSDASSALNSFIGSVPDGSTIVFRAGGTYRLDTGIYVSGRNRLVFEGNGATLRANGSGASLLASPFAIDQGNSYITIRDFTITGNNPNTTTLYNAGQENQFGVGVWGSTNVEIANNTISHTWGDGVYVSGNDTTHVSSDSVWVHDNTFSYIGRSGIALTAGSHVTVEHNSFDRVGIHVFNIEPDTAYQIDTFDTFEDNTVGIYSLSTNYVGYFFAADGAAGSTVHDVTVTGNTVVGNPHGGYGGYAHGLDTSVQVARRANITFTNNSTSTAAAGPVLAFDHVDGVTVTGNTQPLSSRSLTEFTDCTGVVEK